MKKICWAMILCFPLLLSSIDLYAAESVDGFKLLQVNSEQLEKYGKNAAQALPSEIKLETQGLQLSLSRSMQKNVAGRISQNQNKGMSQAEIELKLSEESPLYQEIGQILGQDYQNLGQNLAGNILDQSKDFNFGNSNFSGFSWQRPMGNYGIYINRQVAPDLLSEKFVVTDTLTIAVDAATFLSHLKDEGVVGSNDDLLAAFAGLSFKREYRYAHFADTYPAGLASNFDKLFLSFLNFRGHQYLQMRPNEFLLKEDFISARVGGVIQSAPLAHLSFSGGVLGKYDRVASVMLQSLEASFEQDEFLRISYEKKEVKSLGINLTLQADFLKLLQLTLFRYDYSYSLEKSHSLHLSFKSKDRQMLANLDPHENEVANQVKNILKFKKYSTEILKPFIIGSNQKITENKTSDLMLLLWGKKKAKQTQQVSIHDQDGSSTEYFRTTASSIKYQKNFWKSLLGGILKSLFDRDVIKAENEGYKQRSLSFDYRVSKEQLHLNPEEIQVASEEEVSLVLTQEVFAKKTKGLFKQRYANIINHFLLNYTAFDQKLQDQILKKKINENITLKTTVRIKGEGLKYFNSLNAKEVKLALTFVCAENKNQIFSPNSAEKNCQKTLIKKWEKYRAKLKSSIHLWKLRDFLLELQQLNIRVEDLKKLFGQETTFIQGQISTVPKDEASFMSYFTQGKFMGLSLIDDEMRSSGQALFPMAILNE